MLIGLLIVLLAAGTVSSPAAAARSEERMLSITKTTIYGALLGGLLGLASSLVVRDGYEDDAVRWGVALGSFGGFAYGLATPIDNDLDDLSMDRSGWGLLMTRTEGAPADGARAYLVGERTRSIPALDSGKLQRCAEVEHGGLEEEDSVEEARIEAPGLLCKEVIPACRFGP